MMEKICCVLSLIVSILAICFGVSAREQANNIKDGTNGVDGVGITAVEFVGETSDGQKEYQIRLTNDTSYSFYVQDGVDGKDGTDGTDGEDGVGISDIIFEVSEDARGNAGTVITIELTSGVQRKMFVPDGTDGADGVGISYIKYVKSVGNIDYYKIVYTDGTEFAFTVTNGEDGKDYTGGGLIIT